MKAKIRHSVSFLVFLVWLALVPPALPAQEDTISGRWTGDWGPSTFDRNQVVVELSWDGSVLTGTVNPGPNAVPLKETSYDPPTGAVRMEADAESFRGVVHYVIEGTVEGNRMTGTWGHDNRTGDFTITREE